MLGSVIFERTAKMWATRSSRREDADQRLENIDKKLKKEEIEEEFGKPTVKWEPVSNLDKKKSNFFSNALKFLGF